MIRSFLIAGLLALAAACTTAKPYGPAASPSAQGFTVQPIESDRYRVAYTALSPQEARSNALRRAAEVTLENNDEWFQVVHGYADRSRSGGSRSSVSVGGSTSTGSWSGVGLGVGLGIPIGEGSEKTTESLEIITGTGPKPEDANVYDARAVLRNTRR